MKAYYESKGETPPYTTLAGFRRASRVGNFSPAFKMWKNRNRDQKQYDEWVKKIGKGNMPEDVDKFVEIKYNNPKEYETLKIAVSDVEIREKIGTNEYPISIQSDKQGKHIQGHKNFIANRSYLAVSSVEEGQIFAAYLVRNYSGTGRIVRDKNGKWTHKEIIETKELIGFVKDTDGNWQPTKRATIHYAKDGTHIVPA